MNRLHSLATAAYAINVLGTLLVGAVYLSRSEFMPYHAEILQMAWSDVPARVQLLFLALIHMIGVFAITAACALGAVLITPFRNGETWAAWTIPLILLAMQGGAVYVTLDVNLKTGAHTPWPAAIGAACTTLAGAVLSVLARRRALTRTSASAT